MGATWSLVKATRASRDAHAERGKVKANTSDTRKGRRARARATVKAAQADLKTAKAARDFLKSKDPKQNQKKAPRKTAQKSRRR